MKKVAQANIEGLQVLQIERIQNIVAYHKYKNEKKIIKQKYGKGKTIMKNLFHGTRNTDPGLIIGSEEGFDMRFLQQGKWGRGVYFSDSLKYSNDYSYYPSTKESGLRQVFLAKVLTGNEYESASDNSLKMPPTDSETRLRYDSIRGVSNNSNVHIVYENGRSYPEYLITYSIVKMNKENKSRDRKSKH